MTVREDTITELTATDITRWPARPTHASVANSRKELTKKAAAIKTRYESFPLGTRFGYAAAIMLSADYIEKVNKVSSGTIPDTWTFTPPMQPDPYDPDITRNTAEKDIPKMEAAWTSKKKDHEIFLGVEDAMKILIAKAYDRCWLEEIEDDILEFTVVSAMEMLKHIESQCLKMTNRDKKKQIKNTEFPWLAEEDVTVYFAKLEKEQQKLKTMGIKWDDTQKVTQAVDEMYASGIFDKKTLMEWEEYAEADKDWNQCKDFFKEFYKKEKRFGGTQAKGFEQAANLEIVHEEEMEEMDNDDHLNAFQATTASMITLAAGMAVAKKESEEQIKKLTSKIDHLAALVEKLVSKQRNEIKIANCDKCKKRHPKGMCWEDEENAADRPRYWKSAKK